MKQKAYPAQGGTTVVLVQLSFGPAHRACLCTSLPVQNWRPVIGQLCTPSTAGWEICKSCFFMMSIYLAAPKKKKHIPSLINIFSSPRLFDSFSPQYNQRMHWQLQSDMNLQKRVKILHTHVFIPHKDVLVWMYHIWMQKPFCKPPAEKRRKLFMSNTKGLHMMPTLQSWDVCMYGGAHNHTTWIGQYVGCG